MSEPLPEPLMKWRFIRVNAVRIVFGAVLVAAVFGAMLVWMPYQREWGIARRIESLGGTVNWSYCGPDWIPPSIQDRLKLFNRIEGVNLFGKIVFSFSITQRSPMLDLNI